MDLDPKPASGLKSEEVMRRHILPKALVIGLVAGLISSAFREVLQWSEIHRIAWLHQLSSMERFARGGMRRRSRRGSGTMARAPVCPRSIGQRYPPHQIRCSRRRAAALVGECCR